MTQPASVKKILIIDDSQELVDVFKIIFEKQGYEIIGKTSATDIFTIASETKIDILFLDVYLNHTNGREICRKLKANPSTNYFPIILMSGTPANLIDPEECNADGFMEKPFNIENITDTINSLLNLPEDTEA